MNAGQRAQRINKLRHLGSNERGVLSNAKCLAEGVDVPTLDGVAFIDPKRSAIDITQAVGRAIRKVRGAKTQKVRSPIKASDWTEWEADTDNTKIVVSHFKDCVKQGDVKSKGILDIAEKIAGSDKCPSRSLLEKKFKKESAMGEDVPRRWAKLDIIVGTLAEVVKR